MQDDEKITEKNSGLAFVVNIPLGIVKKEKNKLDVDATIARIKAVQEAYLTSYNKDSCPPFKMVFCINCPENQKAKLDEFQKKWNEDKSSGRLWPLANQIDIVAYPWKKLKNKGFPYGTVRNVLLHSSETQNAIEAFRQAGFYPYVAIGDGDTGKRSVFINDQEVNIFKAIEDKLNTKLISPSLGSEGRMSNSANSNSNSPKSQGKMSASASFLNDKEAAGLPLDDSGGKDLFPSVSLGKANEEVKQTSVHADSPSSNMSVTAEFVNSRGEALSLDEDKEQPSRNIYLRPYVIAGGYRPKEEKEEQEGYEEESWQGKMARSIEEDMEIRDQLAKTVNPLGPYFPEPNLFIDGTIISHVNFGDYGEEFRNLGEEIASFIQKDMLKTVGSKQEETDVSTYLQTNTHPSRNRLVSTFFDLAIETEIDRLFKNATLGKDEQAGEINSNSVAQHHQKSNLAKAAYLKTRYLAARNGGEIFKNLKEFLEKNTNNPDRIIGFYHELINQLKKTRPEYKEDLVYKAYLKDRKPDAEISSLAVNLMVAAGQINSLDNKGKSNRTAQELATLTYTALDIFNTAVAKVFNGGINELLQAHWKNELIRHSVTAPASAAVQQSTSSSSAANVNSSIPQPTIPSNAIGLAFIDFEARVLASANTNDTVSRHSHRKYKQGQMQSSTANTLTDVSRAADKVEAPKEVPESYSTFMFKLK